MQTPAFLRADPMGVMLSIKLQPRASVNEIGAAFENELRVKVTAPPVDDSANEALLRLLANRLDCLRSQIELIRGHKSRHKLIRLYGLTVNIVLKKLTES